MFNKEKMLNEAGFTNDLVFKEVMRKYPDICRQIIERCCPQADTENMTVSAEYEVIASIGSKRIRLDVVSESARHRFDLEMQTYDIDFIKTARYNASMLDVQLAAGSLPKDMPDVTVIFLCTFDPLKRGMPVYTAVTRLAEFPDQEYNDGRKILFLSPTAEERAPERVRPVLELLKKTHINEDDPFVCEVKKAVEEVKKDTVFRGKLMDELLKIDAIRHEEFIKGKRDTLLTTIRDLRDFGIDDSRILEKIIVSHSLDREEALELMKEA